MRVPLTVSLLVALTFAGCISGEDLDTDSLDATTPGETVADFYNASHAEKPEKRWEPEWTFDVKPGLVVDPGTQLDFYWDVSDLHDYGFPVDFIDYTLNYEGAPTPLAEGSATDLPASANITLHKVGWHNFTLVYEDSTRLNKSLNLLIQIGNPCAKAPESWRCIDMDLGDDDSDIPTLTGVEQTFEGTWIADAPGCAGGTGWREGANAHYPSGVDPATWGQTYHAEFSKNSLWVNVKWRAANSVELETHTTFFNDPFMGEHPADTAGAGDSLAPGTAPGLDQRGITKNYAFQDQNTITGVIPHDAVSVYFYSCGTRGYEQSVKYHTPAFDLGQLYPRLTEGYVTESCEQCGAGGANTGVGYRASIDKLEQVFLEVYEEDWGKPFTARTTDNHIGLVFRDDCVGGGAIQLFQPEDLVTVIEGEVPAGARCALMWDQGMWSGPAAPDGDGGGNTRVSTAGAKLSLVIGATGSDAIDMMNEDGLCWANPLGGQPIPGLGGIVYADGTWLYVEGNGIPGLQRTSVGSAALGEVHVEGCVNGDTLIF